MAIKRVAAGTGRRVIRLGMFLKSSIFFFIIFIIFANALVLSIQQKDISIFLSDVGSRILFTTVELGRASEQLISQGGAFDFSQGFFSGLWEAFLNLSDLFSSIFISYYWIKLFAFLIASSPFSDTSRRFSNVSLGVAVFFILQIILILVFFSQNNAPFGLEFEDNAIANLGLPFKSFFSFFRAVPILLSPISEQVEGLIGETQNITTANITNNSNA